MFLELNCSNFHRRFSQYGTLDDLTLCDFFTSLLHDHFFVGLVRSVESVPSWHYCVRVQWKWLPSLPLFVYSRVSLNSPSKKVKVHSEQTIRSRSRSQRKYFLIKSRNLDTKSDLFWLVGIWCMVTHTFKNHTVPFITKSNVRTVCLINKCLIVTHIQLGAPWTKILDIFFVNF